MQALLEPVIPALTSSVFGVEWGSVSRGRRAGRWCSGKATAGGKGFGLPVLDLTFYIGSVCGHSLRDKIH